LSALQDIGKGIGKVLNKDPKDDLEGYRDIAQGAGQLLGDQLQGLVMPKKPGLSDIVEGVGKFAKKLNEDLDEKQKKEEEQEKLEKQRELLGLKEKDSESPIPKSIRDDKKKDKSTEQDFHEPALVSKHGPHGVGAVHHAQENIGQRLDQHEPTVVPHGSEVLQTKDLKNQFGAMSGLQSQVLYESTFGLANPSQLAEVNQLLARDSSKQNGPIKAENGSFATTKEEDRRKLRSFLA
jgi:hypothetical protein